MQEHIEPDGTLYSYFSTTFLMIFALLALGYAKNDLLIINALQYMFLPIICTFTYSGHKILCNFKLTGKEYPIMNYMPSYPMPYSHPMHEQVLMTVQHCEAVCEHMTTLLKGHPNVHMRTR